MGAVKKFAAAGASIAAPSIGRIAQEVGVLAHSADAERAFIGVVILRTPGWQAELSKVEPSDFYLPEHVTVIRWLKQLSEPDPILLLDSLIQHGEMEAAGGAAYVAKLGDDMPRICNLAGYARLIKEKAALRQIAMIGDEIVSLAVSGGRPTGEILNRVEVLSAHVRQKVGQKHNFNFKSGQELAETGNPAVDWIIPGYVPAGAIVELGAKVKMGKSTLALHAVRAIADGDLFLGLPTSKTPTVYLTEQPPASFLEALRRANLFGRGDFIALSHSETYGFTWRDIVEAAIAACRAHAARLLVVDTLPQFAGLVGDAENNSGDALAAMGPLQRAAADGLAVVVVRHERKSGGDVGESSRGSSAFAGAADVVLSLRRPEGNTRTTVRLLTAVSRFSETPHSLLIELTDTGYVSLGNPTEAAFQHVKEAVLNAAGGSEAEAVDLRELETATSAARTTIQRALGELVQAGVLTKIGSGKRNSPFRYFQSLCVSAQPISVNGQHS